MRKMFLSLAALALVASPAFAGAGKYNSAVAPGDAAPAFSGIPAVLGDKDTTLNLADIKEDVVVVVFLANHCPAVTAYEDRVIDFANDYKGKNVKVVALCVNDMDSDRLPAIKERVKDKSYTFAYGYDASQEVGRAYGAAKTPQFFVLDKTRTIRYTGAFDDNSKEAKVEKKYVRDAVDSVLKGESVEIAETRAVGCGIGYKQK
ncbi:thioredoxin family protein [Singulisphaera sp. Ch08]|uniref:Thioredoxin family protein n=1 Tax=Singulisphaera sp. Ch08 TaxID=3120278 RepID=A0AAU7CBF7_9BACT